LPTRVGLVGILNRPAVSVMFFDNLVAVESCI